MINLKPGTFASPGTNIVLLLWLIVLPCTLFPQDPVNFLYHPNDTMHDCYNIPVSKIQEHVYADLPNSFKKGAYADKALIFSAQTAYHNCEIIKSSFVYHDWPALENYLNSILAEITPHDLRTDTLVHVYVLKDGNFNASCDGSGSLFLNIGIFSDVKNEATIAAILAHELSHYCLKHLFFKEIASERGDFNLGFLGESDKLVSRFDIREELQADSMAMQLLAHSKYNLKAMMDLFEIMERIENNVISRSASEFKLKETDHPLTGRRHDALKDYYNKYYVDTALFFVVSAESFRNCMKEATLEILKCFDEEMNYESCIEKAFRFHLMDPDNIIFIHHILESIRKMCYLEPDHWKEMFITNHYYDTTRLNGVLKKIKMKDHLFSKFNFNLLPMSVTEASKIKAKFYWSDELKFKTYNDAFNFYCRVSEALGDHEYLFSNALSYIDDSVKMNVALRKYLSYDFIKQREFAEVLLSNTPMHVTDEKKLLVFDSFFAKIRLGTEDVPIQSYGHESNDELSCIGDSLASSSTKMKALYLPSLKRYNMIDFTKLRKLELLTTRRIWSKERKLNIFILDPDYLDVFRKYSVNEIEFVNCSYFEQRFRAKSPDAYITLMNENFRNFLSQTELERFFNVVISSAKITSNGAFRIAYYSKVKNLAFEVSGYEAVMAVLKKEMTTKEKKAREIERDLK